MMNTRRIFLDAVVIGLVLTFGAVGVLFLVGYVYLNSFILHKIEWSNWIAVAFVGCPITMFAIVWVLKHLPDGNGSTVL